MDKYLTINNFKDPIHEQKSVLYWNEVVEKPLREYTKAVKFENGRLFVEVSISTLRNELIFKRTEYQDKINEKLGKKIVEDVVFINRRVYDR